MQQYLALLEDVKNNGRVRKDRTGVGTTSMFGTQSHYYLQEGFPICTTKSVYFKGVVHELLWFLKGDTNIKYLVDNNVHIWDAWADANGELGPVYGAQWVRWKCPDGSVINQINDVINQIKHNPDSRRIILTAWNPADIDKMALAPCHTLVQFYVDTENQTLSCQLYQRSADLFLGVPFNIASYALLTHMIAQVCGLGVGTFVHTIGDAHIYLNHGEQVAEQLSRTPDDLPTLVLNPEIKNIFDFTYEDIKLVGYNPQAAIKAPVAV